MNFYLTRGCRNDKIEIWRLMKPPILVRGNWKNPAAVNSPKRYFPPWAKIDAVAAAALYGKIPSRPNQCIKVKRRK
jgi:hypothetical protein